MSTDKIISHWPHYLAQADVASEAPSVSEVAATAYGRNRWLMEFVKGGPADDTGSVQVLCNPQGTYGHDHSGAPFGSAFKHTLWSRSWPVVATTPLNVPYIDGVTTSSSPKVSIIHGRWQSRAFDDHEDAPYTRAYVSYALQCNTGTADVDVSMTWGELDGATIGQTTISSSHSLTTTSQIFTHGEYITDVKSGAMMECKVRFTCTARTASAKVFVRSIVCYQNAQISH